MQETPTSKVEAQNFAGDAMRPFGFVRATEMAAIAASHWSGKGDEMGADQAAAEALLLGLQSVPMHMQVVNGEGVHARSAAFSRGQTIGPADLPQIDIALDSLEGTTLCAKAQNDALVVIAAAAPGGLLNVPQVYMEKIAISGAYPEQTVSLENSPSENIKSLAEAKKVPVSEITACVLDRPRHGALIEELREVGCAVNLIGDGDIAGAIAAANTMDSSVDIYLGSGGAPEGVLAAAAIKCLGGQMQAKFVVNRPDFAEKLAAANISNPKKIFLISDLAQGDVLFAATGVTNGRLVAGVQTSATMHTTSSILMQSESGAVRKIETQHPRNWRAGEPLSASTQN